MRWMTALALALCLATMAVTSAGAGEYASDLTTITWASGDESDTLTNSAGTAVTSTSDAVTINVPSQNTWRDATIEVWLADSSAVDSIDVAKVEVLASLDGTNFNTVEGAANLFTSITDESHHFRALSSIGVAGVRAIKLKVTTTAGTHDNQGTVFMWARIIYGQGMMTAAAMGDTSKAVWATEAQVTAAQTAIQGTQATHQDTLIAEQVAHQDSILMNLGEVGAAPDSAIATATGLGYLNWTSEEAGRTYQKADTCLTEIRDHDTDVAAQFGITQGKIALAVDTLLTVTAVLDTLSYTAGTTEQTVFELTITAPTILLTGWVNCENLTQDGTFRLYTKVGSATYLQVASSAFTAAGDDGYYTPPQMTFYDDAKLTYQATVTEGVARDMPFNYGLEVRQ